MKSIFKKSDAKKISENKAAIFFEYTLPFKNASLGVSVINGNYPETGYEVDEQVEGNWYVEEGAGTVWIENESFRIEKGDVVNVPPRARFRIRGENLKLIVSSSPPWFPEQHKHVKVL